MGDKKLKEIILINHFGECPVCNHTLSLLQSEYTAYLLSPAGWITSKLDSKCEYTAVCSECGYTCRMEVNEYGLHPKSQEKDVKETRKPILIKNNPIGINNREKK